MVADLVLKKAKVITMDPRQPAAELVAIKGNKIILVASNEELEQVTGTKTTIIDCQNKTVVPGFNDAHCHIYSFIRKLLSFDISPSSVTSIADIKAVIYQQAQKVPPGEWLTGTGYNEFYLAEKRCPNRWDIDEVTSSHPVVLIHFSLHACVLNSLALSLACITKETTEPPGTLIDRDLTTGEPNGILFEMLGYLRENVMPSLSEEDLNKGIALANHYFLSYGITSLQEATISNDFGRWQTFHRFKDTGKLNCRLSMMPGIEALSQFQGAGLTTMSGDDQLRLGGTKIIVSETDGQLHPPQAELNQLALSAQQAGFQLAIHAVTPSAVEAAITALEYVQSHDLEAGQRHRIEHCSVCPPRLLKQLSKLNIVIVTQPPFLYYSGERYLATVPSTHLPWLYRIKSLLDSGLIVAGSSDCPIVPANPIIGIYATVTRRAEFGQQLLPEECISVEQALAMYTTNAAYASCEESIKGSITPSKLADIVVLSDDPIKLSPEQIKDVNVNITIIDGNVVWEA